MNKELLENNGFQILDKSTYELYQKNISANRVLDIRFPIMYAYWDKPLFRLRDGVMLTAVNEQDGYIFLPPANFESGIKQMLEITPSPAIGYMSKNEADLCGLPTYCDNRFSDYIVNSDELTCISWKYKHKTADYNRFIKNYQFTVSPFSLQVADDCRTVLNNWCSSRNCSDCLFGCEKNVLERYIGLIDQGIVGLVIYSNGKPIGSIIAFSDNDTLYYPYAKADNSYFGISVYMYVELAKAYKTKYVNLGSDGGIDGIRHFKGKFRPHDLIDKYFTV